MREFLSVSAKMLRYFNISWMINNRKKELLLFLASIIFIVIFIGAILEVYLRIKYNNYHKEVQHRERCTIYSSNPRLIYELRPGKCGANSHGFYDHEYSYSKLDDAYRIVVIGDSIAYGLTVDSLNESFPKLLEKKLNSRDQRVDVITLAVPGYSTSQELVLLQEKALKYEPHIIIWSYVLNDPAHPVYHNANGEAGWYYYRPMLRSVSFVKKMMFLLNERIKVRDCGKEYHRLLHCAYWDDVLSNIGKIGEVSEREGVPIIFMIHPVFERGGYGSYSLIDLHDNLAKVASDNNLKVYDLLEEYSKHDVNDIKMHNNKEWYDPWHPNARGHEIIADYLYNKLLEDFFD